VIVTSCPACEAPLAATELIQDVQNLALRTLPLDTLRRWDV